MQERKSASNAARSTRTRAALVAAARELFVTRGYHATGTPQIVARAGLTRGALYHHFADKADLFRAVVADEAAAVAAEIEAASALADPRAALRAGARAYFDAMTVPGRVKLLLVDGPATLGLEAMREIDAGTGGRTLHEGLAALLAGRRDPDEIAVTADLLSAAFDRAALAVSGGAPRNLYAAAILRMIDQASA